MMRKPDVRVPATGLSRRRFLIGAAGTAGTLAAGGLAADLAMSRGSASAATSSSTPSSTSTSGVNPAQGTLVLCTLYGGNDGLNTLIPYNDPSYLSGRGGIAFSADKVIPLDSTYALHPSLAGFKGLWDAGHLAIVRGVGYPDPNLSHFRSMDIWQSAVPETDESTGWIGRWLDATGNDPLRAVAVGNLLPLVMTGQRALGAAVPTGPMVLPGSPQVQSLFTTLNSPTSSEPAILAAIAQSGADMLRVQHTVSTALASTPAAPFSSASSLEPSSPASSMAPSSPPSSLAPSSPAGAASPSGGQLGQELDMVGRLIAAGLPTQVYEVSQSSYDTHSNELATQARLLGELGTAVSAFVNQMSQDPRGQHAVMVIYSEFGRRVQSNASGGTDHGTASVAFVAGPRVKGGYYGDEPSLTRLDADGNLVFTTDFRSVYSTVLGSVLGEDPKVALSGSFPSLNFV